MKHYVAFDKLVDLDILHRYCRLFSRLFGLHFSLINPVTGLYHSFLGAQRQNPFCMYLQSNPGGLARCRRCDKANLDKVLLAKRLHVYRCHAGLTDFVVPIEIEGAVVAVLICGQFLGGTPSESSWHRTERACRDLNMDLKQLRKHYFNTPVIPTERQEILIELIATLTNYFADAGGRIRRDFRKIAKRP